MFLMKIEPGLLIWTIITFLLALVVLWKFAWGPILKGLDERAEKIQGDLDRAEQVKKEAEEKLAEYINKISKAKEETEAIFQDGRKKVEEAKAKIMASAEKEANEIKERTKNEIMQARNTALDEIQTYTADLIVFATKKVISETIGIGEHKKLIDDAITQYEQAQIDSEISH